VPNFTFIGQKCGNTALKTVKIRNFAKNLLLRGDSSARFSRNSQRFYETIGGLYVFNVVAFMGEANKL